MGIQTLRRKHYEHEVSLADWTEPPSPTSARVRFEDGTLETIELPRLQLIAWAAPE